MRPEDALSAAVTYATVDGDDCWTIAVRVFDQRYRGFIRATTAADPTAMAREVAFVLRDLADCISGET